jgi:hypothetical protein
VTRLRARVRELSAAAKISIAIALLVNVVLLAGYVWSSPGQTTHVRFEARDGEFSAYVDGRLQAQTSFEAPAQGGVILTIEDANGIPSVPRPSGIDSVQVHDLDSGHLLYANDFSKPPLAGSIPPAGNQARLAVREGVLEVQTPGNSAAVFSDASFRVDGPTWRNYAVDVTYRNIIRAAIRVRSGADNSGVEYELRPFRYLTNRISLVKAGGEVSSVGSPPLEARPREIIRSMVAVVLGPYPYALLLLLTGFLIIAVIQFVPMPASWPDLPAGLTSALMALPWLAAAGVAVTAFGVLMHYNYDLSSHMPHVPDELSYLFQAKVLAAGHLAAPAPPVEDSLTCCGSPPLVVVTHGHWASLYPFGHPLMLAIGVRIGAVWLIPPLVGAASIVLLFAIGRKLYSVRVGLLAAVLFAASPFFLMTAQNFMSHNTAAFYLLTSILFLAYADRRPLLFPLLSGVFFGLVFNTRQLTGAALVIPFGLLLATFPLQPDRRRLGLKQFAAFATGGALMLLAYFAYRTGTLGSPFASDGIQSGKDQFGFAGSHSLSAGLAHEQLQLTFLVMMLNNWPVIVGFMLVLLPFALGTRNRWDWFFLIAISFVMGVYTLYFYDGFMHGPRFWYETTPLLLLLTARGADMAATAVAGAAARARALVSSAHPPPLWVAVAVVYAFVLGLTYVGWRDWAIGNGAQWRIDFGPSRAQELRGFNFMNDGLVKQIDAAHLHNALVLAEECPGWWCYGNVDWLNSPWLDGDVVFARDLPDRNAALFQAFPDREVYSARYNGAPVLAPYHGKPLAADATSAPQAPARKASSFPTPTAVVPTPVNPADAAARDELRKQHLDAIASALDRYRSARATYPVSGGLQSLCRYPGDAGCALKALLDPLPSDPDPNTSYWYLSADGTRFTLFAGLENDAPPSACPPPTPGDVPNVDHLYCVAK